MTINDFRKNNCQLIMLRPNLDILSSIQSLSDKQILTARNEIDLIAILGKPKRVILNDMVISDTNERASTWL